MEFFWLIIFFFFFGGGRVHGRRRRRRPHGSSHKKIKQQIEEGSIQRKNVDQNPNSRSRSAGTIPYVWQGGRNGAFKERLRRNRATLFLKHFVCLFEKNNGEFMQRLKQTKKDTRSFSLSTRAKERRIAISLPSESVSVDAASLPCVHEQKNEKREATSARPLSKREGRKKRKKQKKKSGASPFRHRLFFPSPFFACITTKTTTNPLNLDQRTKQRRAPPRSPPRPPRCSARERR